MKPLVYYFLCEDKDIGRLSYLLSVALKINFVSIKIHSNYKNYESKSYWTKVNSQYSRINTSQRVGLT